VLRWLPGSAVGAAGAFTDGEKLLPPPGVMFFSVGDGAAGDVVVVVVVLDGLGDSLPPQPADNAAIATIALPPATSASRRVKRSDFMIFVQSIPGWSPTVHRELLEYALTST
jgi:hypothetical protein